MSLCCWHWCGCIPGLHCIPGHWFAVWYHWQSWYQEVHHPGWFRVFCIMVFLVVYWFLLSCGYVEKSKHWFIPYIWSQQLSSCYCILILLYYYLGKFVVVQCIPLFILNIILRVNWILWNNVEGIILQYSLRLTWIIVLVLFQITFYFWCKGHVPIQFRTIKISIPITSRLRFHCFILSHAAITQSGKSSCLPAQVKKKGCSCKLISRDYVVKLVKHWQT